MLRSFAAVGAAVVFLAPAWAQTPSPTIPPPGEETAEVAAAIDEVARALDAGATPSAILSNPAHMPLHPWTRFREAIRDHAEQGAATIVTVTEPGERLTVKGEVVDASGRPLAGTLVYAYQTSAKGWYSSFAVHVGGNSGDERHARLFGYVRTDARGRFVLKTIRPAGYPGGSLPEHIHVEIPRPGSGEALVTEVLFSDDARLTEAARKRAAQERAVICDVRRVAGGGSEVAARLEVPW